MHQSATPSLSQTTGWNDKIVAQEKTTWFHFRFLFFLFFVADPLLVGQLCINPKSGRWQTLGVAAGLGTGPQVQRYPGLASWGKLRLCTLLSLPPPPPTWTRWTTSFGHTSRTSPIWPPTTRKPAWSPPSAEYSPALVEKACCQFWIRIEAVIEAEGDYIE